MATTTLAPKTLPMCRRPHLAGRTAGLLLVLACSLAGCSPEQVVGTNLPPNVPDPGTTHNAAGAVAAYRGSLVLFRNAFGGANASFVPVTGLLTDELESADIGVLGSFSDNQLIDSRFVKQDLGPIVTVYGLLQQARGQAEEAKGLLQAYAPDSSALVGHLDVIQGYAEIFLADLFCSGIPLSTLDFNGDFTYKPGSTTQQVYMSAVALFDTALTLAADSERILNFARVGEGRALLGLGQYAAAAQVVASVPDGFAYAVDFSTASQGGGSIYTNRNFMWGDIGEASVGGFLSITMVDREGGSGMPFLSSGDPRSAWVANGTNQNGYALTRPAKYDLAGDSSMVVASAVEARLIQSEAALQTGGASWMTMLNTLRTDGTYDTMPDPSDPSKTDTLWHAGTGGVTGLAPLADPGTQDARVDLLFRERAFWLFLTGERQGDLRRLIRQYGRQAPSVYPTGTYPGAFGTYGTDVTAPIPSAEQISNPLFTGCLGRGA